MLSRDEVLSRFGSLRQAAISGGKRAPHQPLLLLYLLGRLQQTGTTEVPYSVLAEPVSQLIDEFGPPARSHHRAELPFVHLSQALWAPTHRDANLKHSQLLRADARGRLLPEVEQGLKRDPLLLRDVALRLLESNFPETYFEPICAAVGLKLDLAAEPLRAADSDEGWIEKRKRSAQFREDVLLAYSYACAMCGFDGRLSREPVGVAAAHVHWHALGGPDELANGMALCDLHHTLFDRGAMALDAKYKIEVSSTFNATSDAAKRLVWELHEKALREPNRSAAAISLRHIEWHRKQVFRAAG